MSLGGGACTASLERKCRSAGEGEFAQEGVTEGERTSPLQSGGQRRPCCLAGSVSRIAVRMSERFRRIDAAQGKHVPTPGGELK